MICISSLARWSLSPFFATCADDEARTWVVYFSPPLTWTVEGTKDGKVISTQALAVCYGTNIDTYYNTLPAPQP